MKKLLSFLMAIIFIYSLVACTFQTTDEKCPNCGKSAPSDALFCSNCGISLNDDDIMETSSIPHDTSSEISASTSTVTHTHSFGPASCTSPAVCSCGAINGNALGHSFNQGKCSRCDAPDPNYNPISVSKQNALEKAKSYLNFSPFSYLGLIGQLEYEKFSHEDAVYGADNCGANWNEQALKKAKSYLEFSAFSYSGLIDQLEYEKFTAEQAKYGADNCGADWNEQAARKAESYLSITTFSRQGLIDQLKYSGFTQDQAVHGANAVGL